MDLLNAYAHFKSLEHGENSQIVLFIQAFDNVHIIGEFIIVKCLK